MAIEAQRGCGYRKVNGLYLCGEGPSMPCDRVPFELVTCPTCGSGIHFTRGLQYIDWMKYAGNHEGVCKDPGVHMLTFVTPPLSSSGPCPICWPYDKPQPYALLWIGESFYTPQEFIAEAIKMGVSRRLPSDHLPRRLKLGMTWVLLAHMRACGTRKNDKGMEVGVPGIFYAFRPTKFEKLIWESETKSEYLEELTKSGITPIVVPNEDLDHSPDTNLKPTQHEKSILENRMFFDGLRHKMASLGTLVVK